MISMVISTIVTRPSSQRSAVLIVERKLKIIFADEELNADHRSMQDEKEEEVASAWEVISEPDFYLDAKSLS